MASKKRLDSLKYHSVKASALLKVSASMSSNSLFSNI